MVSLVVYGQVAALSRLVWALGALKRRGFTAALDHLVSSHGALPAIALAAEATAEFPLLLVRDAHVDDVNVARLRQHLERVREHHLARRAPAAALLAAVVAAAAVVVVGARATLATATRPAPQLLALALVVRAQQGQQCTHTCNNICRDNAGKGGKKKQKKNVN